MKIQPGAAAILVAAGFLLAGCQGLPAQSANAGPSTGNEPAAAAAVERCNVPLGRVALTENQSALWYPVLRAQYQLPSTLTVLRPLVQQSNCFVLVEGQGGTPNAMADYMLSPDLGFNTSPTGIGLSLGSLFGGRYGGLFASIGGSFETRQTNAVLTLTHQRTGALAASGNGSSSRLGFAGLGGLLGGPGGDAGGYGSSAQGQAVASALTDAFNQMVRALRDAAPAVK